MRFPWLQVDADFIAAHAGDLAVRLGVSRREAMGLALDLWAWALGRAVDDSPPDGLIAGPHAARLICGAVQWQGESSVLIDALVATRLAVIDTGGVRLTGVERYRRVWEKNSRRTPLSRIAGSSVYFIQSGAGGPIKIGFSDDPGRRLAQLQTGHSGPLALMGWIQGDVSRERELHARFRADRIREDGEWFRPSEALLAYVTSIKQGSS